jgi:hypothetical protein
MEALLATQFTGAWTACEVLLGDLWEETLNAHPGTLALMNAMSGGNSEIQIPLWKVGNKEFDLSKQMGTILKDKVSFTTLDGSRSAYKKAFADPLVIAAIQSDSLTDLAAIRNVIVHKAGIADGEFQKQTVSPTLKTVPVGTRIQITGQLVHDFVGPAIATILELIHAVDDWMVNH